MSSRSFKFVIAGAIAAFLLIVMCVSCSQPAAVAYQQPSVYAQQPAVVGQAPVIVQQQPVVVQGGHDGFFTGMLMGHMMSGGGYGSSHTTTIVHAAPAPVYRPAPVPSYRPAVPTYTPRPSYTTNSRGVSTSISRSGSISVRSGRR